MSTDSLRPKSSLRADAAGFTLLSVLIAVAVMAGLVAAYGRHVVVAGRGGMASPQLLASREACHSGLAFARQSLVSGQDVAAGTIPVGAQEAEVTVVETAGGHQVVSVESVGSDGLGARRTAELALQPSPASAPAGPASLPTLGAPTVEALLDDESLVLHQITESQRIEGAELSGLIVIHAGVELQLADVVVYGAVISASVLEQVDYGDYDAGDAPRLLVDGNLRIDSSSLLPGLAILLPDGAVASGDVDARIQIHGDVVAHDVSLLHPGALAGHVLAVDLDLADAALLDRVGSDRMPGEWSAALELGGASEPVFLAIVPASLGAGSLSAIIDYWQQD